MAKKLIDNPGAGPERELEQVADPVLAKMVAAKKGVPVSQPIYYQRGIAGRDGTGEWVVGNAGAVMMPNGDYAKAGDTFNQRDEGLNDAQIRHLAGKYIEQNKSRSPQPHMIPVLVEQRVIKPGPAPTVLKGGAGESGGPDCSSC